MPDSKRIRDSRGKPEIGLKLSLKSRGEFRLAAIRGDQRGPGVAAVVLDRRGVDQQWNLT